MKTGKTTTASKFPKSLIIAFEIGYLAIPGVKAIPVTRWGDFKQILRQLNTPEAHEIYDNIILDTVDLGYDACEKYICSLNSVDKINEVPYGGGFSQCKREFDQALRSIPQMGYGLVMISHGQDKTFTDEDGKEYNRIVPTLSNTPRLVVNRMSDIIGYAAPVQQEDGSTKTRLYMRGTPRFEAGSRFKYTPDYIEFTYENLVNAIGEAIDKQAEESGTGSVTDKPSEVRRQEQKTYDFDALMTEFNDMVANLRGSMDKEQFAKTWAPKITSITSEYLGKGRKVNECSADQAEQLDLIVSDLREAIKNATK